MSAETNAQIARESLEAAFACDWKRLRETYADDATMVGGALNIRGADNMVALWQGCHEEERDLRLEILNIVADHDMVAVEFYFRGIVNQPLPGLPEAMYGKHLDATEVHMCRIQNGKITAVTIYGGVLKSPDVPLRRVWVAE
ncbi:MAG: nuclear transport factor 2 family protein [Candidatus Latescibacteria bacterium]|nr:nuclear transport factor 2 family protein [Candidatus Latescibacterota bacterium]